MARTTGRPRPSTDPLSIDGHMADLENLLLHGRTSSYRPPHIERLGTLAELTLGGDPSTPDDGVGGAGDLGSLGV